MQQKVHLPLFTLLLMISFASVNAVMFTPALPNIAKFFNIAEDTAQLTIIWFLVGYACGQLFYGPIANRFGRKPALYLGIFIQVASSLLCVLAGALHDYYLLILGRFLLAIGSGVGLKMAYTLVNECYEPKIAAQKISYLYVAFAITPGLGVALGGFLNQHLGWQSCFYAGACYGLVLLFLVMKLPETKRDLDLHALKAHHLLTAYAAQFKNPILLASGLLLGCTTSVVYVFAALAPFLAIDLWHMSSSQYGVANLIPPIGLILGSLLSAQLAKAFAMESIIWLGIVITFCATLIMAITMLFNLPVIFSLFLALLFVYLGTCLIPANASTFAMSKTDDKAHASAVMNFLNMGTTTVVVLCVGIFPIDKLLLPAVYLVLCLAMVLIFKCLTMRGNTSCPQHP